MARKVDPLLEEVNQEAASIDKTMKRKLGAAYAQCLSCRHYIGDFRSEAFDSIPPDIIMGYHNHRQPFKGDGGIHFEPIE